jgi:hypothetical protein
VVVRRKLADTQPVTQNFFRETTQRKPNRPPVMLWR